MKKILLAVIAASVAVSMSIPAFAYDVIVYGGSYNGTDYGQSLLPPQTPSQTLIPSPPQTQTPPPPQQPQTPPQTPPPAPDHVAPGQGDTGGASGQGGTGGASGQDSTGGASGQGGTGGAQGQGGTGETSGQGGIGGAQGQEGTGGASGQGGTGGAIIAEDKMTLQDLCLILWNMEGSLNVHGVVAYNTNSADHNAVSAIKWAVAVNIISSTDDPHRVLTIADVKRILDKAGYDTTSIEDGTAEVTEQEVLNMISKVNRRSSIEAIGQGGTDNSNFIPLPNKPNIPENGGVPC